MTIVLRHRVAASELSAAEIEGELQTAHQRATICGEVEELMETIVHICEDLNAHVERWQDESTIEPSAASILDLYRRLEKTCERTARLGRLMETWKFDLSGKPRFLATWRELKGIVCIDPARVAESLAQIARGECMDIREFQDELSREAGH